MKDICPATSTCLSMRRLAFLAAASIGLGVATLNQPASFAGHLQPIKSELRPGGSLSHTNLSGTYLNRFNLSGAKLFEANLSGAILRRANLSGANLMGANLTRSDLSGANLSEAKLRRATLAGANLNEANLSGADLKGSVLSGADLSRAKLPDFHPGITIYGCPSSLPKGWVCEKGTSGRANLKKDGRQGHNREREKVR